MIYLCGLFSCSLPVSGLRLQRCLLRKLGCGKILAKGAGEMPLGFEGFDVQGISKGSLPCYRLANTSGFLSMSES